MKYSTRRGDSQTAGRRFAESPYGGGQSRERQAERKTRQFCRQVQRALNLALADRQVDDGLFDFFVDDVTPAPDCGHLLVHVVLPDGCRVFDALAALRRDAPRLRSEVAMTISRKRAPELSFVPAFVSEGASE